MGFERIRLSRYCAAIRERNSCLYHICKKNIFCSKYMINADLICPLNDCMAMKLVSSHILFQCSVLWFIAAFC